MSEAGLRERIEAAFQDRERLRDAATRAAVLEVVAGLDRGALRQRGAGPRGGLRRPGPRRPQLRVPGLRRRGAGVLG